MSYLKNLKRTLTIILALVMLAGSIILPVTQLSAATTYKKNKKTKVYTGKKSEVYYDQKKISTSKLYGIYLNKKYMVPYDYFLVKNGPKMSAVYNKGTKVLILTYNNINVKLKVGSKKIWVNGSRKKNLKVAPLSVKMEGAGVIVIPIKRVCTEMGLGFSYDSKTRKIYIGKGSSNSGSQNKEQNSTTNITINSSNTQATAFLNLTTYAFIGMVGPLATKNYQESGVLASVTLAQAINESGWGKTKLAQTGNNLFGMKASLSGDTWGSKWDGATVSIKTREEVKGKKKTIWANFRKYHNIEESIADHSLYLTNAKNGNKLRYGGLTSTKDYDRQLQIIVNGGYCTWGSYKRSLTNLITKYKLTAYDIAG